MVQNEGFNDSAFVVVFKAMGFDCGVLWKSVRGLLCHRVVV